MSRHVDSLNMFYPPEFGEAVVFCDGHSVVIRQDSGDGWYADDGGKRILQSGFCMRTLIRSLIAENERRAGNLL